MTRSWALILHIYQPPGQRPDILDLVTREGYEPLLDFLLDTDAPITLNVTGSLTEQLARNGHRHTINRLKRLLARPNITFTTTAFTHALLPLWSDEIVVDQLRANNEIQKKHLSPTWSTRGAWLPECAYQPRVDRLLADNGVRWAIIDESSLAGDYRPSAQLGDDTLKLAVRHRALSQALATDVEQFATELERLNTAGQDAVVALDGEVFGHFDPRALDRLREVIDRFGNRLIPVEKLLGRRIKPGSPHASTWETELSDLRRQKPYPLWQDRLNPIHRAMWRLYKDIWRQIDRNGSYREEEWVRYHFTNAISSCWFWWANPNRTAGPFKMRVWNPDMIVEGLTELIKAVRSDPRLTPRAKWQFETRHADLLKLVWRTHWKIQSRSD